MYMAARGEPRTNLPYASGEIYMQEQIAKALKEKPAPVILDVGANLGQWSLQFIECIDKEPGIDVAGLRHFAFEPVPATRALLLSNLKDAGADTRVKVVPYAMSDSAGISYINVLGQATSGRNSIVDELYVVEQPTDRIEVEKKTVDAFCMENGIHHVAFMKIDVEGHDFSVIEGASGLLRDGRVDVIQFEYMSRWIDDRRFLKDVFAVIQDKPYSLMRIRKNRLEHLDVWHRELDRFFASNYAIVHDRAVNWFDVRRGTFDASNTYS